MTGPKRTLLADLEIDEVSTVDRPANQHGLITFSKNSGRGEGQPQEVHMPPTMEDEAVEVYGADGSPLDTDTLEHGDVVYDDEGNEFVFVEEDPVGDDGGTAYDYDESGEIGKGWTDGLRAFANGRRSAGVQSAESLFTNPGAAVREVGPQARQSVRERARAGRATAGDRAARAKDELSRRKRTAQVRAGAAFRNANPAYYTAGVGGGGLALGAGGTYGVTRKSLGDDVLVALSKAVTEDDRSEIIAKAMDEVEFSKALAQQAMEELAEERDARAEMTFISKAEEYNLPVAPDVFGPVLKRLVENMDEDDLEVLDTVFKAAGDLLYSELGYVGGGANSSVLDAVTGLADEMVHKAGGQFSAAEATVAMFDANPAAYDAYLQER